MIRLMAWKPVSKHSQGYDVTVWGYPFPVVHDALLTKSVHFGRCNWSTMAWGIQELHWESSHSNALIGCKTGVLQGP